MEEIQMHHFRRGLDAEVEKAAKDFFSSGIGKKIIEADYCGRPAFQVCIRNNYLNVYWRGCSVLKYYPLPEQFTIHYKYVEAKKPGKNKNYVKLDSFEGDLRFNKDWGFSKKIIEPAYDGNIPCLKNYCDPHGEKSRLSTYIDHEEPLLMDLEVAFSRINDKDDNKKDFVADRIDMAELVMQDNSPVLRLVEVKLAADPRLRSISRPEIMTQMKRYREFLSIQKPNILDSYMKIARNYKELGITQIDNKILDQFIEHPILHSEPHLLVLGTLQDLRGREESCHWATLKTLFNEDRFPEPRLLEI